MNTQEKDVKQYAHWVMNDCMNPQKDIEWLVSTILNSDEADFDLIETQNIIEEVIANLNDNNIKITK